MEAAGGVTQSIEATLGVSSGTAQVVAILFAVLIGWLVLQLLGGSVGGLLQKKGRRGNLVLLLGQCGAGKTALFFQLRDCEEVQSVSSLKPTRDVLQIKTGDDSEALGPVEVVDYPGHQRLRGKLPELLKEARCIVYLIDSEDKPRMKDAAEHLYELFTMPHMTDTHTPILMACNKIDLPSARTEKFIVEEIEREIEQMRVSRAATLEGQDSADNYLGIEGEKFKLLEHSPCPVQTCQVSVKRPQLKPVYDFLRQQFA